MAGSTRSAGSLAGARGALLAGLMLLLALGLSASSGGLILWDFDEGMVNAWGGEYKAFGAAPSWARTYLDTMVHGPTSGHSLRITAHRDALGFCGVWLELRSGSGVPRQFLDASSYRYLSFWIKGEKGGEDFNLQLADHTWQERGDSLPLRSLHAYVPQGLSTNWEEVMIPLSDFQPTDLHRLARLILTFSKPGDSRIYLDRVTLKREKKPSFPTPKHVMLRPKRDEPTTEPLATWVWKLQDIFDPARPEVEAHFFDFSKAMDIKEIYLSGDLSLRMADGAPHFALNHPDQYQAFLKNAHLQGLRVDALAGTPEWAAKESHPLALASVSAILAFNRVVPTDARFDGIHFDVEPYALVGDSDPQYRAQLLRDFLEMISKAAELTRTESPMTFACDVPSWFYPNGELDRQELLATFRGETKSVGEHLTDLLDEVTVMDYHNESDGAGGIVLSATPALADAASKGKRIRVGLETSQEPKQAVDFVCGLPIEEFRQRLGKSPLRDQLFLDDFRISVFTDDVNLHAGLAAPANLEGPARAQFEKALIRLARELGAASDPGRFPIVPILDEAHAALARYPEWEGFETFELTDPETHRAITGFRALHRMDPTRTFSGLSRSVFEEEARSAVEWLSRYSSFAGLAVHSYESFRGLEETSE